MKNYTSKESLKFQEEIKDIKCEYPDCVDLYEGKGKGKIVGIARCKFLCAYHWNLIRTDNIKRFNKCLDIPESLDVIPEKLSKKKQTFIKYDLLEDIKEDKNE